MLPAHQLQGELAIPAHQHGSDGGLANASQAWRVRARTMRHARTCPPRAGGVSGEFAPSTQVPVGKRNLAVRSPHARTSRRRKRHRVSKFLSLARTGGFTTVFFKFALQLFALNDLFGFLIILYCPRL